MLDKFERQCFCAGQAKPDNTIEIEFKSPQHLYPRLLGSQVAFFKHISAMRELSKLRYTMDHSKLNK